MKKRENDILSKVDNPWELVGYLFRYRAKEILAVIILLLIGYILVSNISYDKKHGWQWRPSITIEVKGGPA